MRSIAPAAAFALLTSPLAHALRGGSQQEERRLKKTESEDCTVMVAELLAIEPGTIAETIFECEMDSVDTNGYTGLTRKINGSEEQLAALGSLHKNGKLVSGQSRLKVGKGAAFDDEEIYLNNGLSVADSVRQNDKRNRRLAVLSGTKPILAVRVTDSAGKVHPNNAALMGDNIFGTNGDPNNLKSQLFDCSHGVLDVQPGGIETGKDAAPGVIEISINVSLEGNSRGTIRNAVTTAVQNYLGFGLPGPYQQVMYNLEGCYQDCGWAAYAYINSWNSVYQGNYYFMTGVQVHELGHNFNLAHSGGLDGQTYTDHTGLMGNPLYSDDTGKMCYNGAKNWQIGNDWYPTGKQLLTVSNINSSAQVLTMVGVAEYNIRTDPANQPVTVKIETGTTTDYFIAFNRATGANAQNDEADNEVTVTTSGNNGEGYSQSSLKAHLIQGETYSISNFASSGQTLRITPMDIDTTSTPGVATICVTFDANNDNCVLGTSSPTDAPTSRPTAPTSSPTTASPTTSQPTKNPVTPSPTKNPTKNPTAPPVSCAGLNGGACKDAPGCTFSKGNCF